MNHLKLSKRRNMIMTTRPGKTQSYIFLSHCFDIFNSQITANKFSIIFVREEGYAMLYAQLRIHKKYFPSKLSSIISYINLISYKSSTVQLKYLSRKNFPLFSNLVLFGKRSLCCSEYYVYSTKK